MFWAEHELKGAPASTSLLLLSSTLSSATLHRQLSNIMRPRPDGQQQCFLNQDQVRLLSLLSAYEVTLLPVT
ncbi:hypothetical protein HJFPF1_02571 [Paramyrothecium foliicola]|nr:hypothetical protein HJFPF1_02571 [Paramyrothecium foliicola]